MKISGFNIAIHSGILILTSSTGNSYNASLKILYISFSFIVSILIGSTGILCSYSNSFANFSVSGRVGWVEFNTTINGFPILFNSLITLVSASK